MLHTCKLPLSNEINSSARLFKLQLMVIEGGLISAKSYATLSYSDAYSASYCAVLTYVAGHVHVINIYISPNAEAVAVDEFRDILCQKLCQDGLALYCKYIDESAFRESLLQRIVEAVSPDHVIWKYWERFDSYILNKEKGGDLEIGKGLEIRRLNDLMTEKLSDCHYKSTFEDETQFFHALVGENFTERPSFGVFDGGSLPVSWVTLYQNGSIGMMHTAPEYRRRGLARALVRHTIKEVCRLYNSGTVPISCCIMEETSASQTLFTSEGFVKQKVNSQSFIVSSRINKENNASNSFNLINKN